MSAPLAGVFVGGAGKRMGGVAKGLLVAPSGETLVARWQSLLARVGTDVVLVGARGEYAHLGLPMLDDDPPGVGPLGGLAALLGRAGARPALAVACDMPFVGEALLRRPLAAPPAPGVAPRRDGRWEPLLARYDAARVLPVVRAHLAQGRHALQGALDAAGAVELALVLGELAELRDWDTPEDVREPPPP